MASNPLIIIGAGGFARESLDVVDAINAVSPTWDMLGFLVDPQYGQAGTIIQGKPILGGLSWLADHTEVYVVCAVGAPELRRQLIERLREFQVRFATLIHPSVIKTSWLEVDQGTVITAGCVLSNHVVIAAHVHINPSSTIGHDVIIETFASLAPGTLISGNVHIGTGTYIGTGAKIIEKKNIGDWSIVGAGSVVIADVPANTTVVGVPAHVIKERPVGWHLHENHS
ncbi:MAG: acetyltransferase [Chloroflexi bacterium]|uniref:acetyltransferase n=1 Tax=Candidatus Flexifilum breve TaxID=3140694 RepID=UPI003137362A|nr:acetyltransferase [Chloroflexota bacterium]